MCAALVGKVDIVGLRELGLEQGTTHSNMSIKSSVMESDVLLQDDTVFSVDVVIFFIVIVRLPCWKQYEQALGPKNGREFEKYEGTTTNGVRKLQRGRKV